MSLIWDAVWILVWSAPGFSSKRNTEEGRNDVFEDEDLVAWTLGQHPLLFTIDQSEGLNLLGSRNSQVSSLEDTRGMVHVGVGNWDVFKDAFQSFAGQGDAVDMLTVGLGTFRELGDNIITGHTWESWNTVEDIDTSVSGLVKGNDTLGMSTTGGGFLSWRLIIEEEDTAVFLWDAVDGFNGVWNGFFWAVSEGARDDFETGTGNSIDIGVARLSLNELAGKLDGVEPGDWVAFSVEAAESLGGGEEGSE